MSSFFNIFCKFCLFCVLSLLTTFSKADNHNNDFLNSSTFLTSKTRGACYKNLQDITHFAVEIELQPGYEAIPGHFSRTSNLSLYTQQACPVEVLMRNCYIGKPTTAKTLETVHNIVIQPSHCYFEGFNSLELLYRIRNRHLVFIGDSMTMQVWIMLICSLHGSTEVDYSQLHWFNYLPLTIKDPAARKGDRTCPFPHLQHCYTVNSTIYYPQFNVNISLWLTHLTKKHGRHSIQEMIDKFQLQTSDVILINYGAHYNTPREYEELLYHFKADYENMKANFTSILPFIFFRETLPQHFAGHPAGYYNNIKKCAPVRPVKYYLNDYRNRLLEKILGDVMPIIRFANATSIDPYSHIQKEFLRGYQGVDCTHYCMPSNPLYIVRDILFNVFHVFLKENDERIVTLKND